MSVPGDFLYMYLQQVLKLICIEMLTLDSPPIFIHTSPDIKPPPPFQLLFQIKKGLIYDSENLYLPLN